MGLRLRVILVVTISALLAVGAHGLLRYQQERAQLVLDDMQNMALTAKAIQIAVENGLRDRQVSDVRRLLREMVEQQESIDRIRLFSRDLEPTLVSNVLAIGDVVPEEGLRRVMDTGTPESFYQRRGKDLVLYVLMPIRGRRDRIEGTMEVIHLASGIDRSLRAATRDVLVRLSVLVVVIVVVTALALQRQVLQPLGRLMQGIQRLAEGQRAEPIPVDRRDELGRAAEAFNDMADKLQTARNQLLVETERTVELEQQLRRTETLAVAGRLASGLAHEVGTPLNIVSGRAEFLLKTMPVEGAGREDLEIIVRQIDRISRIIGSLLDTVRSHTPQPQVTALDRVLDDLLPLLRHAARRRNVALTTAIPADLPSMLTDPSQLQQVLTNLVLNAVDATPTYGTVAVSAARAERDRRAGVDICVADNGSGIAPELLPRIFDPFVTTKPRGEGTGLGLAICRDIVKEQGGQILVESRVGQGTTFTVWIPEADGAAA